MLAALASVRWTVSTPDTILYVPPHYPNPPDQIDR